MAGVCHLKRDKKGDLCVLDKENTAVEKWLQLVYVNDKIKFRHYHNQNLTLCSFQVYMLNCFYLFTLKRLHTMYVVCKSLLHSCKIQALFIWEYDPAAELSLLTLLPSLKVVASGGVGIDHLDAPFINSLRVKVANTPGVVSSFTADLAVGLLLASARKILEGEIKG